jgi:UDP-N-acetylglucosamine transferase subunit ALG13
MIFLTVGTQFPFDRLIKAVDDACKNGLFDEEIFAQTGDSSYQPQNFESISFMEKKLFNSYMRNASCIISHAGIGTITSAIELNKALLVMPRAKKYGEVVNNHQFEIAEKFEELGHILVAYQKDDLPEKIIQLKSFTPRARGNQAKAVSNRIAEFLNEISNHKE